MTRGDTLYNSTHRGFQKLRLGNLLLWLELMVFQVDSFTIKQHDRINYKPWKTVLSLYRIFTKNENRKRRTFSNHSIMKRFVQSWSHKLFLLGFAAETE